MSEERTLENSPASGYPEAYRSLIKIGTPVLVTQLGVILVSFADTMMVGAYGLNELAASAFVNSLYLISIVMMMGFAGGVTPLIGALYGRGEHVEGGRTLRAAMQVNLLMSVIFTIIMAFLFFFLEGFGQDEEILPISKSYYLIILFSIVPMAVFNCFQQTANGTTDTSTPMWIILGADVLNVVGNYLLIFGNFGFPEMGLDGAGLSTLASRCFAALTIILVFAFRKRYEVYWKGLTSGDAGIGLRRKVWTTSYPLMIQSGVECALWSFGAVVSGWFGKVQLASYQVMNTIGQLGFMIYMSFGWATSIKVSNFTGTGDFSQVRRYTNAGLHIILVLASFSSLVFFFFTRQMVHLFTPESDVIAYSILMIAPLILYQYCDGIQLTYVNAMRGTSVTKPLLWISLISYIGVGMPVLYLMAVIFDWQTVGVYYSFSSALLTAAILLVLTFRSILRKKTMPVPVVIT